MAEWRVTISDETDRDVRTLLAEHGDDLSHFVEQVLRREVLRHATSRFQDGFSDLTASEAQNLADDAVAWARAHPA